MSYCTYEEAGCTSQGPMTHRCAYSGVSSELRRLSTSVPSVPSFLRAAAVILEASGPPSECLRLRSYKSKQHVGRVNLMIKSQVGEGDTHQPNKGLLIMVGSDLYQA